MTYTQVQTKLNQSLTTNASGDYALRTIIEGDQTLDTLTVTDLAATNLTQDLNAEGNYLLNEQTTTNMMSKGTVYRFDGVDDFINIDDMAVQLSSASNTAGAVNWVGQVHDLSASKFIWAFGDANGDGFIWLQVHPTGTFQVALQVTGSPAWVLRTDDTISIDTNYNTLIVHNGVEPSIYINGRVVPSTFQSEADKTAWFSSVTAIDTGRLGCRNYNSEGNTLFMEATMSKFGYLNFAPTADQVKSLISGNLDFKWQYGSQTAKYTETFTGSIDSWAFVGTGSATYATNNVDLVFGAADDRFYKAAIADDVIDKRARMTAAITNFTGSQTTVVGVIATGGTQAITKAATSTDYVNGDGTWTADMDGDEGGYLFFIAKDATACTFTIDDINLYALGAVALYDQTSISETYWYDKANGNDGAVTGASVLNRPENDEHKGIVVNGGFLNLGTPVELTIAIGAITPTQTYHTVDTEADAGTDALTTISGGKTGDILILKTVSSGRVVTVTDGATLLIAGDFVMDNAQDYIVLIKHDGTNWAELSRSNNGA